MFVAPPKDRVERDALGSRSLPRDALYGIHSLRGDENFPVSGQSVGSLGTLLRAMALVKKAAACANARLGRLSAAKADVIARVCDEILAGQHGEYFIVDVFQGGGGTSTDMNMNEVIANRGLELLDRVCGDYGELHPVDDVNQSQSSNDIHAAALRLALMQGAGSLEEALLGLADVLAAKGDNFGNVETLGGTHRRDPVPTALSQKFGAFAAAVRKEAARIGPISAGLRGLNLGATVAGTSVTAQLEFAAAAIEELRRLSGLPLEPAADRLDAAWNTSELALFSALLRGIGLTLSMIASDLRFLSGGPHGGDGAITLPAVQAASSQILGEVNPVIPEMVNQVAFYVAGADVAVGMAVEAGLLQRNPFEPLIAYSLLTSLHLLDNVARLFASRCIREIEAEPEASAGRLDSHAAVISALAPSLGHAVATRIASEVLAGRDLRELLQREGSLEAEEVERLSNRQRPRHTP